MGFSMRQLTLTLSFIQLLVMALVEVWVAIWYRFEDDDDVWVAVKQMVRHKESLNDSLLWWTELPGAEVHWERTPEQLA